MNRLRTAVLASSAVAALVTTAPVQAQDEWRTPDPALVARAREVLRSTPLIEGHNDLPSRLLDLEGSGAPAPDLTRVQPLLPADIPRLREGMVGAQPDDVLARMPENGGVVMVNFYAGFVPPSGPEWRERQDSVRDHYRPFMPLAEASRQVALWTEANPRPRGTLSDVADHIDHIRRIAGIDHVGIGADYYDPGGPSMAEGLDDLTRFPYLFAELLRRGYTEADLRKIAGENLLRAMRAMEQKAVELKRIEEPSRIRFPGRQ